ncbi:MAG: ABC transporter ATP-binding protein, partial [Dehalococcoidia bacterium]
ELGDFIDMPFKSYSQGMAARLAFSIATSFEPEILLMDEWIGAGDTDFQKKARQRMGEMAEKAGIIVLASHNQDLLKRTCNRTLELEGGKVKAFASQPEAK